MDLVLISGLLRLRLTVLLFVLVLVVAVLTTVVVFGLGSSSRGESSMDRGSWRVGAMDEILSSDSSPGIKHGSTIGTGNVWLRGLLELLSVDGIRDWLVGVNGLSDTKVEDGLVRLVEKDGEVSMEVMLLECV